MEKQSYMLIGTNSNLLPQYGSGLTFSWHLCKKGANPKDITLISSGYFCREGMISGMNRAVEYRKPHSNRYFEFVAARSSNLKTKPYKVGVYNWVDQYYPITDEERKLFIEDSSRMIDKGVRFVNMFEKEAGWPLTKAYPMKIEFKPGGEAAVMDARMARFYCLVRASSRWAKSPQLVSLFILLLRNGIIPTFPEFESVDKIVEMAKINLLKNTRSSDQSYLRTTIPITVPMMRDWKSIFPERRSACWDTEKFRGYIGQEGMSMLLRGHTQDKALKERFLKLRKKWANESRAKGRRKAKEKKNELASALSAEC